MCCSSELLSSQLILYGIINLYHQDADKYKLAHPRNFYYLNQSHMYELEGVSDAEEYLKTRRAMDIVGICFSDQVHLALIPTLGQKITKFLFLLINNFDS